MTTKFRVYETDSVENQRSSDYVNLSEPPKPKDTLLTNPRSLDNTPISDCYTNPQTLRRRSTNYADALSRRDSNKLSTGLQMSSRYGYSSTTTNFENSNEPQPRRSISTQVFQDARHDIQTNKYTDTPPLYRRDSRGNYYCSNPDFNPDTVFVQPRDMPDIKSDDSVFKQQFREHHLSANTGPELGNDEDTAGSRPDMHRRKSSVEYENFKKEVYNRLRMFDQK